MSTMKYNEDRLNEEVERLDALLKSEQEYVEALEDALRKKDDYIKMLTDQRAEMQEEIIALKSAESKARIDHKVSEGKRESLMQSVTAKNTVIDRFTKQMTKDKATIRRLEKEREEHTALETESALLSEIKDLEGYLESANATIEANRKHLTDYARRLKLYEQIAWYIVKMHPEMIDEIFKVALSEHYDAHKNKDTVESLVSDIIGKSWKITVPIMVYLRSDESTWRNKKALENLKKDIQRYEERKYK